MRHSSRSSLGSRGIHRALGASMLATGFVAAFGSASCTTPATEVVAGFTTQIRVPKELKSVAVIVTTGGRNVFCRGYKVDEGLVRLPSTIGVVPDEERDGIPPEPVNVNVIGLRTPLSDTFDIDCFLEPVDDAEKDEVMVVRRASLQYTEDRILYVPMPLKESCADVDCEADQSCIGGVCESSTLDGSKLAEYRDELIFGTANTCFSPDLCMPKATTRLAVLTDPDTCTFQFPVPPDTDPPPTMAGALNVEVLYQTGGTEILDLDDREGFTFPDPNDPLTFQLAPNLCTSQFITPETPKIVGVYASPLCPAKTALQPICDDELQGIQEGSRAPVTDGEAVCTFGSPLQATESLLYVLMDRSAAMAEFFGPDGLQFAVDVPLRNPVAAATRVAFDFLPAASTECDAGTAYETPMLGFADVTDQRGPISQLLGDTGSLLADDPMLYLDAAMRGAYTALDGVTPMQSATFNRRAVVIIGNRDFQTHCAGNLPSTPADLAAAAFTGADPIYTYVAVLDAPTGTEQFGDAPQASAAAIATAGGTEVFDAVADEAEGALSVQKVLNDLGSCLYDPLPQLQQQSVTHMFFIDPLTQEQVTFTRNDACTSPDAPVDGFGFDDGDQVVICGQPCAALRSTLTDTATYFAALGQPAPAVPVTPALTCVDKQSLINPN